jgi:hypothetical protein
VLDHWVNYASRFVRNGTTLLPDEIWVADDYARELAIKEFPDVKVEVLPNHYLLDQVAEVRVRTEPRAPGAASRVLYALEPIRTDWPEGDGRAGEFQALDYFVDTMSMLGIGKDAAIVLRPHPSDPPGKYDNWASLSSLPNVRVSSDEPLAEIVAWADWIVGCESYVLVIGEAAGKRVASTLPPWGHRCRLPHTTIRHLKDLSPA